MAKRQPIRIFSFGYYGWGSTTERLVQAVDAVEQSRGFRPPIFVDTRIQRSVRAVGFNGSAFENLLGDKRHSWIRGLGNKRIQTKKGPKIQIAKPEAVNDLLDMAIDASEQSRRLIFFCSCYWPMYDGVITCHRTMIGTLALQAAKRRGLDLEIVEWPGGDAKHVEIEVDPKNFKAVSDGRMTIPTGRQLSLADSASTPWGSIATIRSGDDVVHRLVGPVAWQREEWQLPVALWFHDPATSLKDYRIEARKMRRSNGWEPRSL